MRALLLVTVLAVAGCAVPSVTLDDYRGVATTHFGGIPDQSRVCAVVTNRGDVAVDWVRLRLRAWGGAGERGRSFTSHWLYGEGLEPGESVAVELMEPPYAAQIELSVRGSGRGQRTRRGRPVQRTAECSEAALVAASQLASSDRPSADIQIGAIHRRGDAPGDVLIAGD